MIKNNFNDDTNWPAPPSIHRYRGLEWPQCLNSLLDCSLCVSKFSHFSLFHPPLFIQYSTEECSTVQLLARSLEYAQRIRVVSVFETFICLIVLCSLCVCKFSNYWPATIPGHVTTGKKVASVFEPLACLIVLWLCVSKFSNFFLFHPPLFIQYSTEECSTVQGGNVLDVSDADIRGGTAQTSSSGYCWYCLEGLCIHFLIL